MTLDQFVELARSLGPVGMFTAVLVLVIIYLAKFGGLIKNGDVARIVNVVLSVVFGGFQFGDQGSAFVSVMAALVSALLFELLQWGSKKLPGVKP